jgi:hypothetical protein
MGVGGRGATRRENFDGDDDDVDGLMVDSEAAEAESGYDTDPNEAGGGGGGADVEERVIRLNVANRVADASGARYVAMKHLDVDGFRAAVDSMIGAKEKTVGYSQEIKAQIAHHLSELRRLPEGSSRLTPTGSSGVVDPIQPPPPRQIEQALGSLPNDMQVAIGGMLARRGISGGGGSGTSSREVSAAVPSTERLIQEGHQADLDFLTSKFQKRLRDLGIDEDHFYKTFCPLCGFSDNSQDAIYDRDYEYIKRLAEEGVGNIDESTHAYLLCWLWNKNIYLPMRQHNKRILPLSHEMALSHLQKPHRMTMNLQKMKMIKRMDKAADALYKTAFGINPVTNEPWVETKRIDVARRLEVDIMRVWSGDVRKDSFNRKPPLTGTNAGAGVNPLQHTYRE